MKWIVCVLIMVIAILIVICYALMVAASDAEERAEEMYREWEHHKNAIPTENNNCVSIAMALLDDDHEMYREWREKNEADRR